LVSNVECFVRVAQQSGLDLAGYTIQCFTFVPDQTGYIAVLNKVDGSLTQCVWLNVPPNLDKFLDRESCKGIRHVAVGANNSYVVVLNTGTVWWQGIPASLRQLLSDAEKKGLAVVVSIPRLLRGRGSSTAYTDRPIFT
jgi:hypothetical protein